MANSTLSKTKVRFDRKPGATANADQTVDMTLGGNTLSSIKKGTTTLVADTDYTVAESTVTFPKTGFFDKAEHRVDQSFDLTFNFSAGDPATLKVDIYHSEKEAAVLSGHTVHIAADPEEANSTAIEQCPNCKNAIEAREAGNVDHCHYCGAVLRTNN